MLFAFIIQDLCVLLFMAAYGKMRWAFSRKKMDTKNAQEKPIDDSSLILASFWSDF